MYKASPDGSLTVEKSLILGKGNDVNQTINKTFLNKIQAIPFEIDQDMHCLLEDTLKPAEEDLSHFDATQRELNFLQTQRETNTTIDYLIDNGNKFWFLWKFDKRQRSYSQGYHVNPQGNAYRKAILNLANKHSVNPEGLMWLKIDIANCMGYDKDSWYKRVKEANAIIADVFATASWEDTAEEYALTADAPELFLKAIYAYNFAINEGEASGHSVGLDATASGLQVMSALSGCPITARNCNMNPLKERTLTIEAQEALELLEAELASL